jgi:small-conductance mechanosensitive channel
LHTGLDDFYVNYQIIADTAEPQRIAEFYSNLYGNIQNAFHHAGIEIASSQLSAIRDGNHPNMPQDYLPKHCNPPAFPFSMRNKGT